MAPLKKIHLIQQTRVVKYKMIRIKKNYVKFYKILLISVLLVSLSALLFYPRHTITAYNNSKITAVNELASNNNILSVGKNMNIEYKENTLFRKYTINFNNTVNESQWIDLGDKVNIYLKKSEVVNSNLKNNTSVKGIKISNLDEQNSVIAIKKDFEEGNRIYIDPTDNKKLIILICKIKNPYTYKVVLDPGHGGRDPGYINGTMLEKDFTLKICNYIYNDLMFNGCQVILTRETDIELDKYIKEDLIKRANIANNNNADVFVSIHLNSGNVNDEDFKKYKGVTTYYFPTKNKSQNNQGLKLAQTIQKHAIESDNWNDQKILPANDSVLRNTVMPSALVECGFLTNSDDIIRLENVSVLNNLGTNIGEGIMEYIKNKKD